MYGNGGYLILDFKNTPLTTPINIPGIYNKILKSGKPIVVVNCPSISDNVATYVTSCRETASTNIILSAFLAGNILQMTIEPSNKISYVSRNLSNVSSTHIESEVSTNASKSDSNTDK